MSLLSRQRTTKALIRLRGCAGWSASLLFTYDKNRLSHDVAHFQINRSYLCLIRRKRVCCIQLTVKNYNNKKKKKKTRKKKQQQQQKKKQTKKTKKKKKNNNNNKKQLLIYHSVSHFFCRGFIENKFVLTPSICVRNGTMRLLWSGQRLF